MGENVDVITGEANSRWESARARVQAWTGCETTPPYHARDRRVPSIGVGVASARMPFENAACSSPRSTRQGATTAKKAETRARGSNKALCVGVHAVPTCSTVGCTFEPRLWQRPRPQKCVSVFLRNERYVVSVISSSPLYSALWSHQRVLSTSTYRMERS